MTDVKSTEATDEISTKEWMRRRFQHVIDAVAKEGKRTTGTFHVAWWPGSDHRERTTTTMFYRSGYIFLEDERTQRGCIFQEFADALNGLVAESARNKWVLKVTGGPFEDSDGTKRDEYHVEATLPYTAAEQRAHRLQQLPGLIAQHEQLVTRYKAELLALSAVAT